MKNGVNQLEEIQESDFENAEELENVEEEKGKTDGDRFENAQ